MGGTSRTGANLKVLLIQDAADSKNRSDHLLIANSKRTEALMIRDLFQDIRYGARMLRKNPGLTFVAAISLSLGIGAVSTIFSFINGTMLRPLPYKAPERLVILDETALKRGVSSMSVSFPNFLDWRAQNKSFEDIGCYTTGGFGIGAGISSTHPGVGPLNAEPEMLQGAFVSEGTFEVLGIAPILGRTFTAEEDQPDHDL
jgi:putative ABC transport system permease protein